MQSPNH